jgi:hypothetical protein
MGIANESYYYYKTTRKIVSVFGAMFNDIYTARELEDGTLTNMARVPLSYGPRSKFLSRIREENRLDSPKIGIRLPRMSFEITSMDYDTEAKLNRLNRRKFDVAGSSEVVDTAYAPVPYNLGFELNIMARTQDDALQILEQIIPLFTPEYTISVKDIEGPGTTTDVPFSLESISMSDDYEGDFNDPRTLIYTLSFSAKVRYLGSLSRLGIIRRAITSFLDLDHGGFYEKVVVKEDEPKHFVSTIDNRDTYQITLDSSAVGYVENETVIGETSGYGALTTSVSSDSVNVKYLENTLILGENLIGETSGESLPILDVQPVSENDV